MDDDCTCSVVPEKYHYVYYGTTEPGSMWEWNPDCPVHLPWDRDSASG